MRKGSKVYRMLPILVSFGFVLSLSEGSETASKGASEGEGKELTVDQIVQKTNYVAYYQGQSGRAQVSMTIKDDQGREQKRQFTILRRDEPGPEAAKGDDAFCGDQKFYVYFLRPADVRKMAFLAWKHVGADDDRWLYLPAWDLVKRIAASDGRTSFAGSNFFYEDVSGRGTEEDEHELVNTTDNFYVLKNTPKTTKGVEFAYYTMWIHRKTFLPIKIEYFKGKDEKYRVYDALKVETIQGFPTVVQSRMRDLATKSETVIEYSSVQYDIDVPDSIFTERYLRQAPTEYLR
jgi:hypothetical protein